MAKLASLFLVFFAVATPTADAAVQCGGTWVVKTGSDDAYCPGLAATCKTSSDCCTQVETCKTAPTFACDSGDYNTRADVATGGASGRKAKCCAKKATCAAATTCVSGYVKDTNKSTELCPGAADTCSESTCCKIDDKSCRSWHIYNSCPADKTKTPDGAIAGSDAATCCIDAKFLLMCGDFTCPKTMEHKIFSATTTCLGNVCTKGYCCQHKFGYCGHTRWEKACKANRFMDLAKDDTVIIKAGPIGSQAINMSC